MFRLVLVFLFSFSSFAKDQATLTDKLKKRSTESNQKMSENIKDKFKQALQELRGSGLIQKAIKQGAKIPDFLVNGKKISTFYSKKPVVLKFYRGSWCPYCQLELKEYEKYKQKIEDKGYQVLVLTPDTFKEIIRFKRKQSISFQIYQDVGNLIAKKMGIAFQVNNDIVKIYKEFGIHLEENQGNANNELPLPGTYIINQKGEITFAYLNPDYTQRLDPLDLLKLL
ncbi:AhpC/TSA family protein [Bacteriovoracaceae bacterium]|nr:AhpC/TSA family protein [Bacteriovoracaceae bacterium]